MDEAELLHLAFNHEAEHAVILLDTEQRVTAWLGAATRLFGYTRDEMLGETLERLFTPEDLTTRELANEFESARSHGRGEDDRWLVRKGGVWFWASGAVTRILNNEGDLIGFVKTLRDRTDIRTQLEALQNRLDAATLEHARKDLLVKTMAHELRAPLSPLTHSAEFIKQSLPDASETKRAIEIIERQVRLIRDLVTNVLEQARIGQGQVVLAVQDVDLRSIVDASVETCSGILKERDQCVELILPDLVRIDADPLRLQQVLVNLITNAAKFSPTGATIWVKATVEAHEIVIRVEDRGRGIPGEWLPRIFELFTQAAPLNEHQEGLGLGLALVKELVEMHSGTVQVRSEGAGRGTEVSVRLPLRRRTPEGL
jgi:two-component system CheB/CheR fusion protein